jgi:hypothetical protein
MQVIFYENHIDFIIHRHYNVKSRQGDCPCLASGYLIIPQ